MIGPTWTSSPRPWPYVAPCAARPAVTAASPTTIRTYSSPVSNDGVTLGFKQTIGASDALRTGTYAKTLTFTLSTTNP